MVKYYLTNKALEDLSNIWNYTFDEWSEKQADFYYEKLISSFKEIVGNPNLGKKYDGVLPNLLGLRVNKHIVFYRKMTKNKIEITRILHGRMDLKNHV